MWAAAEGHSEAARVLVEVGADLEAKSSTGITPLMFAIRAGHIPTTLALLDLGANLTALAPDGTTSLGLAIINAHWELAAALLDRGADPNTNDPRGRPLHLVAHMRTANNRVLSAWLPRRPTGLIDSMEFARRLIAKGATINDRTNYKNGMSAPTHMALAYFTMISWNGVTPLFIASKGCDTEFINVLLANGADAAINNEQGVTPRPPADLSGDVVVWKIPKLAATEKAELSFTLPGAPDAALVKAMDGSTVHWEKPGRTPFGQKLQYVDTRTPHNGDHERLGLPRLP
jgi:ankyrin repeat protein